MRRRDPKTVSVFGMKVALICGVSGQDGAYLARYLLERGYRVWGSSRDAQANSFKNLKRLGIFDRVSFLSIAQDDARSVLNGVATANPDEIYFLSGQSSVGLSFEQPAETFESLIYGVLNFLEAIRFYGNKTRFYHASSSECFGNVNAGTAANESYPFKPRSPYGVAKASAHWMVVNYREAYGLHCSNGILFNHESPLRPQRFVTQKIVSTACRIAAGSNERLKLGNLTGVRDWGWAPDFVEAMWLMLQQDIADDYVVATGKGYELAKFVEQVFAELNLDREKFVDIDQTLFRPSDISNSVGDPRKALDVLGWESSVTFQTLIQKLVKTELAFSKSLLKNGR